uniref:Precursor of CEP9-like n=1 Tax=Nelumbo nucifera TaxID=4432 RepID=A0A822XT44_NELNU|nr:TPA_asm: hypothetical protein HUJ06_023804 [Nelumbo nucifera]
MAKVNCILTCASLLFLVFSHQLCSIVEGRPLSLGKDKELNKKSVMATENSLRGTRKESENNSSPLSQTTTSMVASMDESGAPPVSGQDGYSQAGPLDSSHIDGFRPTTPGHSPGIGHSHGN